MKEIRTSEIRTDTKKRNLILSGRPIVFETPTQIEDMTGQYIEIIKRNALDGTDLSDISLLYNHDLNKVPLARTPKTMQLEIDANGLNFTATLPETVEAHSIYEAVKRGDIRGMSFAFKVPKDGDSYNPQTNTRTITKIEKIYELSIVPFPAYPTTSIEARGKYEEKKKAKILINQILKVSD